MKATKNEMTTQEKNSKWTINTDVTSEELRCKCGGTYEIYHNSNWHDGTGLFYASCDKCGDEKNVQWKYKD